MMTHWSLVDAKLFTGMETLLTRPLGIHKKKTLEKAIGSSESETSCDTITI